MPDREEYKIDPEVLAKMNKIIYVELTAQAALVIAGLIMPGILAARMGIGFIREEDELSLLEFVDQLATKVHEIGACSDPQCNESQNKENRQRDIKRLREKLHLNYN